MIIEKPEECTEQIQLRSADNPPVEKAWCKYSSRDPHSVNPEPQIACPYLIQRGSLTFFKGNYLRECTAPITRLPKKIERITSPFDHRLYDLAASLPAPTDEELIGTIRRPF